MFATLLQGEEAIVTSFELADDVAIVCSVMRGPEAQPCCEGGVESPTAVEMLLHAVGFQNSVSYDSIQNELFLAAFGSYAEFDLGAAEPVGEAVARHDFSNSFPDLRTVKVVHLVVASGQTTENACFYLVLESPAPGEVEATSCWPCIADVL